MSEEEYKKLLGDLKNICDFQSTKGNYDQGDYMRGLANGLIMAVSIFEKKEPKFFDIPTPRKDELVSLDQDKLEELIKYSTASQIFLCAEKDMDKVFESIKDLAKSICQKYGTKQEMSGKAIGDYIQYSSIKDPYELGKRIAETFSKPAVVYPEKKESTKYKFPEFNEDINFNELENCSYNEGFNDAIDLFRKMNE